MCEREFVRTYCFSSLIYHYKHALCLFFVGLLFQENRRRRVKCAQENWQRRNAHKNHRIRKRKLVSVTGIWAIVVVALCHLLEDHLSHSIQVQKAMDACSQTIVDDRKKKMASSLSLAIAAAVAAANTRTKRLQNGCSSRSNCAKQLPENPSSPPLRGLRLT